MSAALGQLKSTYQAVMEITLKAGQPSSCLSFIGFKSFQLCDDLVLDELALRWRSLLERRTPWALDLVAAGAWST